MSTRSERSEARAGSARAEQLWGDWERGFGRRPGGSGLLRRSYRIVAVAGLAVWLVAMTMVDETRAGLEAELSATRDALAAREGELLLARQHLSRLHAIQSASGDHRIPADLAGAIHDIAAAEGIDPAIAFSLVRVESRFTRRAVSSAGAVGLTQVMPSTAFWLDPSLRYPDLFERETNLRLGFRYLRQMLEQYEGDLDLALLAYNRGPWRVDSILRAGGNPENGYSKAVLRGAGRTAPSGR